LIGLGLAGFHLIRWVSGLSVDLPWAALFVSLYLIGGMILGALGLSGEYLGRIYEQVKGRPLYFIKDQSPEILVAPKEIQKPSHFDASPNGNSRAHAA
jgi:hypothetical protein